MLVRIIIDFLFSDNHFSRFYGLYYCFLEKIFVFHVLPGKRRLRCSQGIKSAFITYIGARPVRSAPMSVTSFGSPSTASVLAKSKISCACAA